MRKNIERVVNAFIARTAHAEKNLSTDGEVIRSYDMIIVQRIKVGRTERVEVISRDAAPTVTTGGHIGGVSLALHLAGMTSQASMVQTLSGRTPHVFRDRAGHDGYLSRGDRRPAKLRLVK